MPTNRLGDLVLGSRGLSQALGKPSRVITRPVRSGAAPGNTEPKGVGTELGRQEAIPERGATEPAVRARDPRACLSVALGSTGSRQLQGPGLLPVALCAGQAAALPLFGETSGSDCCPRKRLKLSWGDEEGRKGPMGWGPGPKAACGDLSTCPARPGEAQKCQVCQGTQAPSGCWPGLPRLLTPGREAVLSPSASHGRKFSSHPWRGHPHKAETTFQR